MAKGRKVCADEAAELLEQWKRSGEPMSTWCVSRGLNWYSLSGFKGWLCTRREAVPAVAFAEIVVDGPAVVDAPVEAEARVRGRYRVQLGAAFVEVDDHFREGTLRRLLQVVGSC